MGVMRTKHLLHPLVIALCAWALCLGTAVSAQDVAGDLLGRINALRASLGLSGYRLNGALSAAAQSHAQWMAETGQVSHTQPNGSTPTTRAAAAGYPGAWVSENIYAGSNAGPDAAWGFWINSPIHYRGLTNASYDEIGIGSASTSWGRAYVLVFGASGSPAVSRSGSGGGDGGGNSAAAAPPSFVVGVDASGNIMHEIQDGHTPGDIALIYGYTWDDIPAMLALNGLTEADQRALKVGSIFLVPPQAGTYTPTPGGPTVTPGVAPADLTAIAQAVANTTALPPAPSATPEAMRLRPRAMTRTAEAALAESTPTLGTSLVVPPRISTAAAVPVEMASPTPTSTPEAILSPTPDGAPPASPTVAPTEVVLVITPAASINPPSAPAEVIIIREGTSPWLIGALVLQAVVIAFAAFEFARRARR
jgi:uncharacterized protein YkwD